MSGAEDVNQYLKEILERTNSHALALATTRCSKTHCGIQGTVLQPGPTSQRVPGSNVVWFEDMVHGVGCEFDEECPYSQHLEDVTAIFGEAAQMALQEMGIVGLVEDSPGTPGLTRDN